MSANTSNGLTSAAPALAVENLQFSYNAQPLTFPNLSLQPNESCAILGASGCGKTTFLHLLAGLLTPQAGSVAIAGKVISEMSQRQRDHVRGRQIGIVLQQLRLIKALTVMDNLLLAQRLAGQKKNVQRAQELLEQLHLGGMEKRRPAELSLGQQQRVAIARALVNQPDVILADEPTSSLDDQNAQDVVKLLMDVAASHNAALVVVTHDARIHGQLDKELVL